MSLSVLPMVLYVYCRTRPNEVFNFFFDIQIRALHFPWVLAGPVSALSLSACSPLGEKLTWRSSSDKMVVVLYPALKGI